MFMFRQNPLVENLTDVPQAIFMSDMILTFLLLGGLRMAIRLYYEEFRAVESGRLKRFLIVGAGNAGEALLREIHRMPVTQYEVVGFVDDEPMKQGINIHGIPVLGTVDQLPKICADNDIEEIAMQYHRQLSSYARNPLQKVSRFFQDSPITDIARKIECFSIRDDINDLWPEVHLTRFN
jgi:FlaA1/EpsC-like NDP-sugar epimerase